MKRITDHVFQVTVTFGTVNFYVLDTGSGLAVIDMGVSPGDMQTLEKGLQAHKFSLDDIQYLLLTHAHSDHVGCLIALQNRVDATTYAHVSEAPIIRAEQPMAVAPSEELNMLERFFRQSYLSNAMLPEPARVDIEVVDGDTLNNVMYGLEVVHLPGHTNGQVGYWLPQERILFAGDGMMNFFGRMTMPFRFPAPDWKAAKNSVRKIADLNPKVLCLGHGPVITGHVRNEMKPLLNRI